MGICGTPGTGKKTVAPLVARRLKLKPLAINSLVPNGESEVDVRKLRRRLLDAAPPPMVLYGHLLPHVLAKPEAKLVAVLRCEPAVLRERLAKRGYPRDKLVANVEAELIGVSLDECVRRFGAGAVREYDTTSATPERVAAAIARDASGGVPAPPLWIDWTLDYGSSTRLRSLLDGKRVPPAST